MATRESPRTNFAHLEQHDEQLVRLGMLAERYFADDPNTALLKLRQLAEFLAQLVAAKVGLYTSREEAQYDLLRRLQDQGILPREAAQLFGEVRRAGNAANHAIIGDHRTALAVLKITWQLGIWFHRTFANAAFKSGPFVPPSPPKDESEELRAELLALSKTLAEYQTAHHDATERLASTEAKLREAKDEQTFWEQMAIEAEEAKAALALKLAADQAQALAQPKATVAAFVTAASTAASAVELDEADTRKLIDEQLRDVGWTVDSAVLTYAKGARPEKGKNLAIAEWPTARVVDVAIVRPGPSSVRPKWLMHFLNAPPVRQVIELQSSGTTRRRISRGNLAQLELPVPPLPEQKRIADKLDALLARVDACRERLDRVPGVLKRFRQAVLAAATSGELTREWREERGLAREWAERRVEDIAFVGTGSTPLRSNSAFYAATGTPWITSSMTGLPFVTRADEFVTDAAIAAHRLKKYPVGTLLVAMYGEGKTRGQVTELRIEATINQACAAICVDERKALTTFVRLALEANYLKMRELAEGRESAKSKSLQGQGVPGVATFPGRAASHHSAGRGHLRVARQDGDTAERGSTTRRPLHTGLAGKSLPRRTRTAGPERRARVETPRSAPRSPCFHGHPR
jgi:hypothetical protein